MCVTCLCLVAWEVDHKAADALQWEALAVGVRLQEVQAADALHRVAREADVHQLEAQAAAAQEAQAQVTASAGWLRGGPGSSEELRQRSTSGHGRLGWSGAAALLSSVARL